MGRLNALTAVVFLILLTGCFSYKPVELKEVSYVEILKINPDSIAVEVTVQIENPNGYRIKLTEPDVDLFVNDKLVGQAVFYEDLVLDKRTDTSYVVPVSAAFDGKFNSIMIASLGGLFGGNMTVGAKGTIVGKAGLIRKTVPFEFEQDLSETIQP